MNGGSSKVTHVIDIVVKTHTIHTIPTIKGYIQKIQLQLARNKTFNTLRS